MIKINEHLLEIETLTTIPLRAYRKHPDWFFAIGDDGLPVKWDPNVHTIQERFGWRDWKFGVETLPKDIFFEAPTGYIIDCERSGIVVIDEDNKDGKTGTANFAAWLRDKELELPETLTVRTASGGFHRIFLRNSRFPLSNTEGLPADGVDIRGDGGMIVAEGSRVKKYHKKFTYANKAKDLPPEMWDYKYYKDHEAFAYEVFLNVPVVALPDDVAAAISQTIEARRRPVGDIEKSQYITVDFDFPLPFSQERLNSAVEALRSSDENWHNKLYRQAVSAAAAGVSLNAIDAAFRAAASGSVSERDLKRQIPRGFEVGYNEFQKRLASGEYYLPTEGSPSGSSVDGGTTEEKQEPDVPLTWENLPSKVKVAVLDAEQQIRMSERNRVRGVVSQGYNLAAKLGVPVDILEDRLTPVLEDVAPEKTSKTALEKMGDDLKQSIARGAATWESTGKKLYPAAAPKNWNDERSKKEFYTTTLTAHRVYEKLGKTVLRIDEEGRDYAWDADFGNYRPLPGGGLARLVREELRREYVDIASSEDLPREAKDMALTLLNGGFIAGVTSSLASDVAIPIRDFNNTRGLLLTLNGIVSFEEIDDEGNCRVYDITPVHRDSRIAGGSYLPEKYKLDDKSTWDEDCRKVLASVAPDCLEYFIERLGKSLTGWFSTDDTILLAEGSASNGKSSNYVFRLCVAGDYGGRVNRSAFAAKTGTNFSKADMEGKRVICVEEVEDGRFDGPVIKDVVNDPELYVERKGVQGHWTINEGHIDITSNRIPQIYETDDGTWRRIAMMKFPYTFVKTKEEADPSRNKYRGNARYSPVMIPHLPQEAFDCYLTLAIQAGARWMKRNKVDLPLPPSMLKATNELRHRNDKFHGWFDENFVWDPSATVLSSDVYESFKLWSARNGLGAIGAPVFKKNWEAHHLYLENGVRFKRMATADGFTHSPAPFDTRDSYATGRSSRYFGFRFKTLEDREVAETEQLELLEKRKAQQNYAVASLKKTLDLDF